jgi:sarcosine oxidase
MSRILEVGVVGGGIAGLCAAWAFTRRGHRVTLFEQAPSIPNELSASGDQHRILRHAYGHLDGYARLMPEADAAWARLWIDLGTQHFVPTGVLILSQQAGDRGDMFRAGLDRAGQQYKVLDAQSTSDLYPFLSMNLIRYALVSDGGILMCREIARDLVNWLLRNGARIVTNAHVRNLEPDRAELDVVGLGRRSYDQVVVAAGAWAPRLLPHLSSTLINHRNAVVYLEPPPDLDAAWASAPAIAETGGVQEGYILPPVRGAGLKAGIGAYRAPSSDPDECLSILPGEGARLLSMISPSLTRATEYRITGVRACSYVCTRDDRFHGEHLGKVTVISACSGHGYKFAAAVGLRLAGCVEKGEHGAFRKWLVAEAA